MKNWEWPEEEATILWSYTKDNVAYNLHGTG